MAKSLLQVDRDAEEGECARLQASDSSDDSLEPQSCRYSRRVAAIPVLSLLAAAVIGTLFVMSKSTGSPSTKSAHHLMQSQEFHHASRRTK